MSDQVADRLEAQDSCGAAGSATELTSAAIAAINERKVPTAYLEDFLGAVNELQAQIPPCEQPAEKGGKGKKKGHEKKKDRDDEEEDD